MASPPDKSQNTDSEQGWEPGQLLLGDFEVQRVLGQGGMGKVYLVRSRTTAMEFAVKHALIKDDNNRQNFLSELQTWIDLPEHPHIAACRFFRTIGDEIAIFSEYVGGGTLADWIRERRLNTLEQILDVAIQFAWGLQALHEHGLIHQDVKPGNVLMTPEGIAKVTDFGLARARLRGSDEQFHSPTDAPNGQSVLVSVGGMTQAYCSPEQAAKQPLSHKTDIWSWGVSVLDMFYGQPSCLYGQTAAESLETYFQEGTLDKKLPRMPVEMTMILGKCFQQRPENRWENMADAADSLIGLYQQTCCRAYPRQITPPFPAKTSSSVIHDTETAESEEWVDPRDWLRQAFRAAGRSPSEAGSLIPPGGGSRRARAIADLAIYEQAYRIFEKLFEDGRKELEDQLAEICFDKAHVHKGTDDLVGAGVLYDRAIQLYEHLENLPRLAFACANKAIILRVSGDLSGAVKLYDRAINIYETLLSLEYNPQLAYHVALDYVNKAVAIRELGDIRGAVALYDLAIPIYKRLVDHDGRQEVANALATAWMNKANALHFLSKDHDAIACYDRAIAIRERLVNEEGRRQFEHFLAASYVGKALAVNALGNNRDAIVLYDRGIAIYERLVNKIGQRRELGHALGNAYMNKARSLYALNDICAAVAAYNLTIQLYERLVNQEGRRELTIDLASVYLNQSNAVIALGDARGAVLLCESSIALYERLVNQEGRQELSAELALAYMKKAFAFDDLGDKEGAIAFFDRAIEIRERLVNQENRRELADDLAEAYSNKANVLFSLRDMAGVASADQRAIQIYESLVSENGSVEFAKKLASACMHRALALSSALKYREAVVDFDVVIGVREGLMKIDRDCDLVGDVASAKACRGIALFNLGQAKVLSEVRAAIATLQAESARTGRADLEATLELVTGALVKAGHPISVPNSE